MICHYICKRLLLEQLTQGSAIRLALVNDDRAESYRASL